MTAHAQKMGLPTWHYRAEVWEALEVATAALKGDSNDADHDALYLLVSVLVPKWEEEEAVES